MSNRCANFLTEHWPVSGIVSIPTANNGTYKVYSNTDDYIAKLAYYEKTYEPATDKFMEIAISLSQVLLDVGSNTGHFALAACAQNPHIHAYAFEPVPSNYQRLKKNVSLNNFFIETINEAVTSSPGHITMYVPPSEISLSASSDQGFHAVPVTPMVLPADTIDNFIKKRNLQRCDIIKIDVEWHELDVLKGAVNTLSTLAPLLVIEILFAEIEISQNPSLKGRLNEHHAKDIADFMRAQGYYFYKPTIMGLFRIDDLEINYDERNYIFSKKRSARQFIAYTERELLIHQVIR